MKGSTFVRDYGIDEIAYFAFDSSGTDTDQMTPDDRVARVSGALGAGTIYLPSVSECPLMGLYFVVALSVAGGNVTVAPFVGGQGTADSVIWECEGDLAGSYATSEAITAANGWILLMAMKDRWIAIASDLDAA
jgi:hypothetical protein